MPEIQNYTYHCHTNFSDGYDELAAMVHRAKEIGFAEIGISDHLIVHKNMRQGLCWPFMEKNRAAYVYNSDFKSILDKYRRHCDDLRRMSRQENFRILVGFEVDYFPYNGWEEEFRWFISQLDADYLHTGNHFFCSEDCEQIINMTYFSQVCTDASLHKEYFAHHFRVLEQAVNSRLFKFLAHMDYMRRYTDGAEYGEGMFWEEKEAVLQALQKTNTALEISTKGLRRIGDFYPDSVIMRRAGRLGIAAVISDDAHSTAELGEDFDKAEAVIKKAGITKRLKF